MSWWAGSDMWHKQSHSTTATTNKFNNSNKLNDNCHNQSNIPQQGQAGTWYVVIIIIFADLITIITSWCTWKPQWWLSPTPPTPCSHIANNGWRPTPCCNRTNMKEGQRQARGQGQQREGGEVNMKNHSRDINISWVVDVLFFFCWTNDFLLLATCSKHRRMAILVSRAQTTVYHHLRSKYILLFFPVTYKCIITQFLGFNNYNLWITVPRNKKSPNDSLYHHLGLLIFYSNFRFHNELLPLNGTSMHIRTVTQQTTTHRRQHLGAKERGRRWGGLETCICSSVPWVFI